MTVEAIRPDSFEVAVGTVLGRRAVVDPLPVPEATDPLAALEEAIVPALERAPCVVSFSGGRDSSAVLAAAVLSARRHGLPAPIPATVRFHDSPGASEPAWQELVVRHLGLADWDRIDVTDELDLVGPYGAAVLRRHGILYPPSLPLYALLAERAAGGSLLTGLGGDQVLGGWLYRHLGAVAAGRARPSRKDLLYAVHAASPRPVRRAVRRRRAPTYGWLRPEAQRRFREIYGRGADRHARTWRGHLATVRCSRALAAGTWAIARVGQDADVLVLHPLVAPGFLGALARAGRRRGLGDRTDVMRALLADVLPAELLARGDKALYHHVYFREASRGFARRFAGEGLDPGLVDPEKLRETWLALLPSASSALALQAAWLASARELEQPGAHLR